MATKIKYELFGGPLDGDFIEVEALELRVVLSYGQVNLVAVYAFKGDRYLYEGTNELGQVPSLTDNVVILKAVPSVYADDKQSFDGFPVRRWKRKKL